MTISLVCVLLMLQEVVLDIDVFIHPYHTVGAYFRDTSMIRLD